MTPALVAAALATLTAALLLEERSWRRKHPAPPTSTPRTLRCLCCEGAPLVEDMATHSRLVHQPREVGAEDHSMWGAA